jgi:hypothetical protein
LQLRLIAGVAASPQIGFQFIGPADCDREFFDQYCGVQGGNSGGDSLSTGTRLAVGAVTGSGTILTKLLDGKADKLPAPGQV